jgi:hypothetical protein
MVSPNDHVVMNHQNHTRTNGIWGHVRYKVSSNSCGNMGNFLICCVLFKGHKLRACWFPNTHFTIYQRRRVRFLNEFCSAQVSRGNFWYVCIGHLVRSRHKLRAWWFPNTHSTAYQCCRVIFLKKFCFAHQVLRGSPLFVWLLII